MTSDRHLALMALMREVEEPTRTYQRSIRLAAALETDSPQWDAAVAKGKAALDVIERVVRFWVEGTKPEAIPGLCNVPSPDGLFMCRLEPHGTEIWHADRDDAAYRADHRHMIWTTPVGPPAGFERHACVTVACAVCGVGYYDEAEGGDHFPSIEVATDEAISGGWGLLQDSRVVCTDRDEKHDELRNSVGVIDPDDDTGQAEVQR